MRRLHVFAFAVLLVSATSCAGVMVEGRVESVQELIRVARTNGAYRCAPRELALAETHLEFAKDELSQGRYVEAKELVSIAERAAKEAIRKSPPDRCAKKVVVAEEKKPKPVKLVVTKLDADGDGILDENDKCPHDPEDFDNFEDKDGCPDKDNDGDGLADKVDECPGTDADKENNFLDVKEDKDDFQDDDGCPDKDNDGDGLADKVDECPGTAEDAKNGFVNTKEDKDNFQDDDGCPDPDNDGDGVPDVKDKCPGTAEDAKNGFVNTKEDRDGFQDDDGCPDPDNDGDGIPDVKDKCPNQPETRNNYKDDDGCPDELKFVKVTKKKIELKQKIFFEYNKAIIKPESFPLLNEIVQVLKDHPTMVIRIEGHTDSKGSARYNLRLSRRRAQAVRKYLIAHGIDPARLKAVGYGESRPIASNDTPEGRELNRRVEFVIIKQ